MSLVEPPEDAIETARLEMCLYIEGSGSQQIEFEFEGLTPEAAVGYLLCMADNIRQERKDSWDFEDDWEDD